MPCAGTFNFTYYYRDKWGRTIGQWPLRDKKLQKRVSWIANCASVAAFYLIYFDDWKSNAFKVFMEVLMVRVWYETGGRWFDKDVDLIPTSCYYLGTYPWYWDYKYGMPQFPGHGYITYIQIKADPMPSVLYFKPAAPAEPIQPFSMTPSVYTQEYLPLKVYTRDDIEFFHGAAALQNMDRQIAFLNERSIRRTNCLINKYFYETPPKPKIFELLT